LGKRAQDNWRMSRKAAEKERERAGRKPWSEVCRAGS